MSFCKTYHALLLLALFAGLPSKGSALHLSPTADTSCGIRPHVRRIVRRVVNGQSAAAHSWPWMAEMIRDSKHTCGATLVHPQFVVTAAHCMVIGTQNLTRWTIRLGEHDRMTSENTEQDFQISEEFLHPLYNSSTQDNDVAVLKLSRPAKLSAAVGVACLPQQNVSVSLSATCYITGWGRLRDGGRTATVLQQAWMPIVPNKLCAPVSKYFPITSNMLCSGFGPNSTVSGCHFDSGGPFVCEDPRTKSWFLQGSVTGGTGPCGATYSVYARTSRFSSWIRSVISEVHGKY